jgi:hypothetical protein
MAGQHCWGGGGGGGAVFNCQTMIKFFLCFLEKYSVENVSVSLGPK